MSRDDIQKLLGGYATGTLTPEDVAARVAKRARIYVSPGSQFGPGGASWLRFNFATPRPIYSHWRAR